MDPLLSAKKGAACHAGAGKGAVFNPRGSDFDIIHKVTKFDVCPWGMIFRNRKRAQALRSFQINPWSPGYRIVLQCTGGPKRSVDWAIEKGSIRAVSRDYRCPWDRSGARLR